MTKIVNVHEAKTHLSALLEEAQNGTEIILAKAGKPYVRLVPIRTPNKRPLGFVSGKVDPAFFDPLPVEETAPWE